MEIVGRPQRVLVVDDDHGFLDLLTSVFCPPEFELTCVDDPLKALDAMKRRAYGVVLLDFHLPSMDGDVLIAGLQAIDPSARYIVLSGHGADEIEDKFRGRGYHAFFEKGGLDIRKLRQSVRDALNSV